jgi:hypothetical protein
LQHLIFLKKKCSKIQSCQNLERLPKDPFEKNMVRPYRAIIKRIIQEFGDDGPVDQVTPQQILPFLNRHAQGNKPCKQNSAALVARAR